MRYRLCVVIYCLMQHGFSQNYFDIANLSYTSTLPSTFENSSVETSVEELALEFNFPIKLSKKTALLTGVFANKSSLKLDMNSAKSSLNVLGLNFGVNRDFNETWSATYMLYGKIASDEITLSKDNLQLGALALFTKKKRTNLKFRYGVYVNTEKYGIIVVPIFGLYYFSSNNKFEANLNLPIIGDLNYRIQEKLFLGIRFDGLGTTYNLNQQNFSPNGAYVSKTSNELIGYFRYKLTNSIYVNTKIGYAIGRNYRVFDTKDKIDLALSSFYFGDDRTQLNSGFSDGLIFKVDLLYRLHF